MVYTDLILCLIAVPLATVMAARKKRWLLWYLETAAATLAASLSATILAGPRTGPAFALAAGFVVIAAARVESMKCGSCGGYGGHHQELCAGTRGRVSGKAAGESANR